MEVSHENPWSRNNEREGTPMLNMDQMRHVAKIVHSDDYDVPDGESTVCSDEESTLGENITAEWYDEEDDEVFFSNMYANRVYIRKEEEVTTQEMIVSVPDGKLSRNRLLQKSDPAIWRNCEFNQLESHHRTNCLGAPCKAPKGANIMKFQ